MPTETRSVTPVVLPADSGIAHVYESANLADAYSIQLPVGATTNPELLARFIFSHPAPWVTGLMTVRDALVAPFGLKVAPQLAKVAADSKAKRIGIFKIYSTSEHEIVLGEDDTHLDFRISILCAARTESADERRLVLSTVVRCHNRLGRIYILLIAPFHRLIVQSSLRRAAHIGWPRASTTPSAAPIAGA
jgi:hypothetical protein